MTPRRWLRVGLWALALSACLPPGALTGAEETNTTHLVPPQMTGLKARAGVELDGLPGLAWTADLNAALRKAQTDRKLVFLAIHAQTNFGAMVSEKVVFRREPVRAALKPYVLVLLYADIPRPKFYATAPSEEQCEAEAKATHELQRTVFQREPMPHYAILAPAGEGRFKVVAEYDGKLLDTDKASPVDRVGEFLEFLRKPVRTDR